MIVDTIVGAAALGTQILDGVTTYYALTHGATEMNPILISFGLSKHPKALLALKLGLGVLMLVIATLKANSGYQPGEVTMGAVAVATGVVGTMNLIKIIRHKASATSTPPAA